MTAVIISLLVRFYQISDRPLHTDEAVNSVKLKYLLEDGEFEYDPIEYHGPTLYYFALLSSWISGKYIFEDVTEANLRGVNVVFTSLLFLFIYLYRNSMSITAIIIASVLLLVSPFLNFYSRYFIHESLFSSFIMLMIISYYRFHKSKKDFWAIWTGIFAGLIFATKETSIIVFTLFIISLILTKSLNSLNIKSLSLIIISFIIISVLLFSSFFSNMKGIIDSFATFGNYLSKSSAATDHIQPWYYYLNLYTYNNLNGIIISEIIIVLAAVVGIIFSFKIKEDLIFKWLSFFALLYFLIFSIIPYKTPWNIMTGWITLILLGGYGFSSLFALIANRKVKIFYSAILSLFLIHLMYQSYNTSFKFADTPQNPFTYSQPTRDIFNLTDQIENIIDYNENTKIYVIAEDSQYWPLPWYFRGSGMVSWNNIPGKDLYRFEIIVTEPKFITEVTNILYTVPKPGEKDLYVPLLEEDVQIRPGKEISAFIKNNFLNNYLNSKRSNDFGKE